MISWPLRLCLTATAFHAVHDTLMDAIALALSAAVFGSLALGRVRYGSGQLTHIDFQASAYPHGDTGYAFL